MVEDNKNGEKIHHATAFQIGNSEYIKWHGVAGYLLVIIIIIIVIIIIIIIIIIL